MKPPATIIAGEVVLLRDKLNWFERLPLFGQKIVITRAREQAGSLAEQLTSLGAEICELPTIELQPPADFSPLDNGIANLHWYDWLIFTSVNGVRFFIDRLDHSNTDFRSLRAKICAIGPATRAAIAALHLKVDLMGEEYVAESLVAAFAGEDLRGKRVLLPRAAVARDLVPAELSRRGAQVDVVEAYRTVLPAASAGLVPEIFATGKKPDWITFTSSSTVRNFLELAGAEALRGVKVAAIGPVTSATARELGIEVTAEAQVFTVQGLVEAMLLHCPA
jgi:uroporphyrinogen III methyltransferase/synthase